MDKLKKENPDLQTVFDERLSVSNRKWVLENANLTQDDLVKVALYYKFPSLSMSAFSMMGDEVCKANTLIKLFGIAKPYEIIAIAHSAVKGIKSQRLLWDVYMHPNTPDEVKPYIEDAINGTGTSVPAVSHIIRTEELKDEFSED